jgi:hypothetical protein
LAAFSIVPRNLNVVARLDRHPLLTLESFRIRIYVVLKLRCSRCWGTENPIVSLTAATCLRANYKMSASRLNEDVETKGFYCRVKVLARASAVSYYINLFKEFLAFCLPHDLLCHFCPFYFIVVGIHTKQN